MEKTYFIGVDIGGSRIKAVIRDDNSILKEKIINTNSNLDKDIIIQSIINLIQDLFNFVELDKNNNSHVCCIGVGVPGIFEENGKIINLPNLSVLNGVNFSSIFKEEFGSNIKVKIVNDATLPFYYYKSLNDVESKNILFLTLGTGIGSSLCLNGNLHTSKFNSTEISRCYMFGDKICEDLISEKYLLTDLDGNLEDNKDKIKFDFYGKNLGLVISNLHNVLGFDKVVLSGGICKFEKYFYSDLVSEFEKKSYFKACDVEILKNVDDLEIGAVGASYLFD